MGNKVDVLITKNNDDELVGTVYYNGVNTKRMDNETKNFATHLSRKADYYFCDPILYKTDTCEYLTKTEVDLLHDINYCIYSSLPGEDNVRDLCQIIKLAATNLDIDVPFTITNGKDSYTITSRNVNNYQDYYEAVFNMTSSINNTRSFEKRI